MSAPIELVRQRACDFGEGYEAGYNDGLEGNASDSETAWDRSRASAELSRVAAPTPYFTPEEPPQNCDAKLWRLICLRVHALHEENERLRARVAAPTPETPSKEKSK